MKLEAFDLTKVGEVAEVRITGEGRGNPLGVSFFREAPRLFAALEEERDVHAVVLYGDGDHFSVGIDLAGVVEHHRIDPDEFGPSAARRVAFRQIILDMQDAVNAIERCRVPVIAAIHGFCRGAALSVAAACDFRFCAERSLFSMMEVKVALVSDLGALQRLPRIIGEGVARELAYTGRGIDAAEALRIGLVNRVLKDRDELLAHARRVAGEIAANPPLVVEGTKHVLNYSAGRTVEEGLSYTTAWNTAFLPSRDFKEACVSMAERRSPRFVGD